MDPREATRAGDQRGIIVIWFAFFLFVSLFFVALGVDGAKLAATRIQLQNAADAAALAGASAIDTLAGDGGTLLPALAIERAQETGRLNRAMIDSEQPVDVLASDVTFPAANQCQVVTRRQTDLGTGMATVFARLVGRPTLDLTASATAVAEPADQVCDQLMPIGVITGSSGSFTPGCADVYDLVLAGSASVPSYRLLQLPACDEGACAGQSPLNPGTIGCQVEFGYGCCVDVDQSVDLTPVPEFAVFQDALQERWDADADQSESICYQDYRGTGQRVLYVPRIEHPGSGGTSATVLGFTALFLRERPDAVPPRLEAEFLYQVVAGSHLASGGDGTTLYALKLLR